MSDFKTKYHVNHAVFEGGRYLNVFSCLDNIDCKELLLLLYFGSKMPFDKGFVGRPAFPSIATISRDTKIPESTVRVKIKSLVEKGYVIKKMRWLENKHGKKYQSSNDYYFTNLAFEKFELAIAKRAENTKQLKRVVGTLEVEYQEKQRVCQASPCSSESPLEQGLEPGEPIDDGPHLSLLEPNSSSIAPEEDPQLPPSSIIPPRSKNTVRSEIDQVVICWEEVLKKSVSVFERRRFTEDFTRLRANSVSLMEMIAEIESDPYLAARAKSINWLLTGFGVAKKNRNEIVSKAKLAIQRADSLEELTSIESRLPGFIQSKSDNFLDSSQTLVQHLFGDKLNDAKAKFGGSSKLQPKNLNDLRKQIAEDLRSDIASDTKSKLQTILDISNFTSFSELLNLYCKHMEA